MAPVTTIAQFAEKTPAERKSYALDWSDELGADTIAISVWAAANNGLTIDSDVTAGPVASVVVSGGRVGASVLLTNTITTAGGSTFEKSGLVPVVAHR